MLPEAGIQLAEGLDHPEASPHGPMGVVFVRERITKIDQQAIAKILSDMALIAYNHLRASLLIGPDHLP
jgi:hypothetical protein